MLGDAYSEISPPKPPDVSACKRKPPPSSTLLHSDVGEWQRPDPMHRPRLMRISGERRDEETAS